MMIHFPESHIVRGYPQKPCMVVGTRPGEPRDLLKGKNGEWAINKFKPYKSPGPDGILPALLQKGINALLPSTVLLCRASYTLRYLPKAWRGVKVVYVPKAWTKDPKQPKSYRPISLIPFLLKTMEKLIGLHIRLEYLVRHPLH
jgi:hypothetical protein